jgi:hypothetical protein
MINFVIIIFLSCRQCATQDIYSLRFKIKVTSGHKLRYKIKITFGEISLKFCQTNWNVARIIVNVVVDELPSQKIIVYTCLAIDV